MTARPVVTTIVHTFNRPQFLREAVEAIQRQTYTDIEIILIDNGATPETVEYLKAVESSDKRVKIVHFQENQFSWEDPGLYIAVTWNAALKQATGDYVWIQEDDDYLADDYIEKMVSLFNGNPECTTAAGLPIRITVDGDLDREQDRISNIRTRYTDGKELTLNHYCGDGTMFGSSGTIFTIRRDVLLESGGYHRSAEDGQLLACVPFGITGFDSTALFYWRNHEGQVNKRLTRCGDIGIEQSLSVLDDLRVEDRWGVFGADIASGLVRDYTKKVYKRAANWFVIRLYGLKLILAIRILGKCWSHPYFWTQSLAYAVDRRNFLRILAPVIKPPLKILFRTLPALGKLSPGLRRLRNKADRWT